jgi:phage nucleotide-binding protein
MPSIKFSPFSEYFQDFCPHICLYSYNGCGKTSFAGRTGLRTVLFDCSDAGVVTLRGAEKLRIKKIRSINECLDALDEVNRRADDIELLVIDTLTGLQSIAIKEVKGKRGDMSQRKFGQANSKVIECISEARNFPRDIIYLAQERRKTRDEGEGDITSYAPSITPGTREFLSGSVDWVGRMFIEGGKRKLSFILTDATEAKDRANLFPKILNLPDIQDQLNPAYLAIRKRIVEAIHV